MLCFLSRAFLFNIKLYHQNWSVVKVLSKHLSHHRKTCKIRLFRGFLLFPLIFVVLLLLIYALNIILNGNFEPVIPPIISFIKIFVAENVAKPLAG
jgi:hypothetical protein